MSTKVLNRCALTAALAVAAAAAGAAPAIAQIYYGSDPGYYPGYMFGYPGAPGQRWNAHPPVGRPSGSWAARHENCPVGTDHCY